MRFVRELKTRGALHQLASATRRGPLAGPPGGHTGFFLSFCSHALDLLILLEALGEISGMVIRHEA
jgi:hypothetical protein